MAKVVYLEIRRCVLAAGSIFLKKVLTGIRKKFMGKNLAQAFF